MVMVFSPLVHKNRRRMILLAASITVLLLLTAASAYPPKDIMGGFQEGTSEDDMQAVYWAREKLDKDSTIASDMAFMGEAAPFTGIQLSSRHPAVRNAIITMAKNTAFMYSTTGISPGEPNHGLKDPAIFLLCGIYCRSRPTGSLMNGCLMRSVQSSLPIRASFF